MSHAVVSATLSRCRLYSGDTWMAERLNYTAGTPHLGNTYPCFCAHCCTSSNCCYHEILLRLESNLAFAALHFAGDLWRKDDAFAQSGFDSA